MSKHLTEILGENFLQELLEVYSPFPDDERRFVKKHGLKLGEKGEPPVSYPRFNNMYSEKGKHNADHLFTGSTKVYDRPANRHGYAPGKDQEHYESYENINSDGVNSDVNRPATKGDDLSHPDRFMVGRKMSRMHKGKLETFLPKKFAGDKVHGHLVSDAHGTGHTTIDLKHPTAGDKRGSKWSVHKEDFVDEAHSKVQAKQAATAHGVSAMQRQKDIDAINKKIENTGGLLGTKGKLKSARDKLERRRNQHWKARNIAKKMSGDLSPLTNDGDY